MALDSKQSHDSQSLDACLLLPSTQEVNDALKFYVDVQDVASLITTYSREMPVGVDGELLAQTMMTKEANHLFPFRSAQPYTNSWDIDSKSQRLLHKNSWNGAGQAVGTDDLIHHMSINVLYQSLREDTGWEFVMVYNTFQQPDISPSRAPICAGLSVSIAEAFPLLFNGFGSVADSLCGGNDGAHRALNRARLEVARRLIASCRL